MCCSFFDGFSVKVPLTKELLRKSNHTLGLASAQLANVYWLEVNKKSRRRTIVDARTLPRVEKMDLNPTEEALKPNNTQLRRRVHHRFCSDFADVTS